MPILLGSEQSERSRLRLSSGWHSRLRLGFTGFLQRLLPAACAGCQTPGSPFCEQCYQKLTWVEPPVCMQCGHPINVEAALCRQCQIQPLVSCRIRAVLKFASPVREAVHALKYKKQHDVAAELATIMARGWVAWASMVDLVVPVPLHAERYRARGFNQSAEIARHLATALNLPIQTNVLFRPTRTRPQVGLNREARLDNVRNAFQAVQMGVSGKHILLIDDVCTTGATLGAASDALYTAGAASVTAYVLARAQNYREHQYPELERLATT